MTTDKLLTTLEAALIGESSKCWVDVYAVQLAVDKIKAAEELDRVVAKYEDESAVWQDVLDAQVNYRAAGDAE